MSSPQLPEKLLLRLWMDVIPPKMEGECAIWTKVENRRPNAILRHRDRVYAPRRLMWFLKYGEHPDSEDLILSSCDIPLCINPDHMVAVSKRWRPRKDSCKRGHEFTEENVYWTTQGKRACRKCIQERGKRPEILAQRAEYKREMRRRKRGVDGPKHR